MTPLTKGLFSRAILQSGAPTSVTTNDHANALKQTEAVAKLLNCTTEGAHLSETLKCLKSKSIAEILKAQSTLEMIGGIPLHILGDKLLPFKNFVTELNSGRFHKDIDFMYGVMLDEGYVEVHCQFLKNNFIFNF